MRDIRLTHYKDKNILRDDANDNLTLMQTLLYVVMTNVMHSTHGNE